MSTKTKTSHQNALFEIKSQSEDSIIYQRVIAPKNRSVKEIAIEVSKLPTATLHAFTTVEYNRLKEIESEIYSNMTVGNESKSLKDRIFSFLEI